MAQPIVVHGNPSIVVQLTEVDDQGYVQVNGRHFDLPLNQAVEVTGAMRNGLNEIQFVVKNTGSSTPFGANLPPGAWKGRFELYIGGSLQGEYYDEGNDGLNKAEHTVANVQILAN